MMGGEVIRVNETDAWIKRTRGKGMSKIKERSIRIRRARRKDQIIPPIARGGDRAVVRGGPGLETREQG